MVAGELKVATVESVESIDNMATLPVSQRQHGDTTTVERNNSANKEAEAKKDKKHKEKEKGKETEKDPNQPKK